MDAGSTDVAKGQERLGEVLVEFGAVKSEASRLVAARSVHVTLGEGGCMPGFASMAEGG